MPSYYIDPSYGTGGSGTESDPFDAWADVNGIQTTGDIIYIKGGETLTETVTPATGVTVRAYGGGRYIIDGASTRNQCVYGLDVYDVTIEDFDLRDAVLNNIRFGFTVTSGTTQRKITIRNGRCDGTDQIAASPATPDVTAGTAVLITTDGTSDTGFAGYIGAKVQVDIANVDVTGPGKHGFDFRGDINGVVRNCTADDFGTATATLTYGGHGFTVHPWLDTVTSGWSGPTSSIYSRSRTNANDVPSHIINATDGYAFVKNTATPTTPGLGEWGYSGTTIYVRLKADASPAGKSIRMCRKDFGPLYFIDCKATNGKVDAGGGEGNGFAFDSVSFRVHMQRCISDSNGGDGLSATLSGTCTATGCRFLNNTGSGVRIATTTVAIAIYNCTAAGNTDKGFYIVAGTNYSLRNCIGSSNTAGNLLATAAATATDKTFNWSYNGGAADTNITAVGTTDPLLDSLGRPRAGSPVIGIGSAWWAGGESPTGEDGRRFTNPPTIGAYERYGTVMKAASIPVGADSIKARLIG